VKTVTSLSCKEIIYLDNRNMKDIAENKGKNAGKAKARKRCPYR
jgi:hypothetical protein